MKEQKARGLEITQVALEKLRPHPKNPRVHPESALRKLARSIEEFGWTNPILASSDGYILAGHARLKAAELGGLKEVPVIYLPLTGRRAVAYIIADNRLQDETDWDWPLLKEGLEELASEESADLLELTGFDAQEIDDMQAQFFVEEDQSEPRGDMRENECPKCGYRW